MSELSTRFNFKEVEARWCDYWERKNIFHAKPSADKPSYAIVIPPPNVTGILHMGHALNNTLQDILIRYKRMCGYETCWMPGTDHAGIATQNVVEKQLAKEGKTRYDIGREELLKRLWAWKQQYGDTIIHQLKKLGSSCDWPRTRFTMDDDYSEAVKEVFVLLYEKGLIYQGRYIINWCPRCQTALSDEESEHRQQQGALYHIRYPLQDDPARYVIVATTRPETMLGDTAVAVHPQDLRYRDLIGKILTLPLVNRPIKVITDDFVDPAFGTGAVKVTPAHDPNDFAIGQRHNLEFLNVMYPDGRMNALAGEDFAEMDRFEAREAVIEALKERKLLEKVEPHLHAVGHCYRCHTVVEPYLSKQWFVRMKPLAQPAAQVVRDGRVRIHPERWKKVYLNWMDGIRDWCISRQIWWGHRIPVWYCVGDEACQLACQEPIVAKTPPQKCPHCGSSNLKQDEDVLDTWFSSWLWPFATFGWPQSQEAKGEKTALAYFYPTNALFTASEIIFFWVARMVMAGLEFMGDVPFSDVYIHGTVRDAKGIKMSKSLGNALDPLEIIEEYGADALRFSLIINSGQDLFISKDKFEIGRNFANKIWNASRLVLMNCQLQQRRIDLIQDEMVKELDLPSRWIISRFYNTLRNVSRAVETFRYSEAESLIYEFFWGNFCDWYLEIVKNRFDDIHVQKTVFAVLEQSIRMMHPFLPFVTEEIWQHLDVAPECLAVQPWPVCYENLIDEKVEADMQILMDIVAMIRNFKVQWNIKPQQEIVCQFAVTNKHDRWLIEEHAHILQALLRMNPFEVGNELNVTKNAATGMVSTIKFCLPLAGIIDIEKEKNRMLKQIEEFQRSVAGLANRLNNEGFVQKAPPEVVEKEKNRLADLQLKIKELEAVIQSLG
jgi:valyl-tRNA synthetase